MHNGLHYKIDTRLNPTTLKYFKGFFSCIYSLFGQVMYTFKHMYMCDSVYGLHIESPNQLPKYNCDVNHQKFNV